MPDFSPQTNTGSTMGLDSLIIAGKFVLTFVKSGKNDIAAKRRKKHKNQISGQPLA